MYLKSLMIKNFRKFGDKNNVVEFVGSKGIPLQFENINIALSTTLIVGKNNSGKTTVTEVLKRLLDSRKFKANDFNFIYLSTLLDKYKHDKFEHFPSLEFEVTIRINFNSDCDLVTNIAPFMSIDSVQSAGQESDFRVVLKYELQESLRFKEEVQALVGKHKDEAVLFRKFLDVINNADFKLNYYDSEGVLIGENKFKINDLLNIKPINANKNIDDKSLSEIFSGIIKFRYKLDNKPDVPDAVTSGIDKINETIEEKISGPHTSSINTALSKIESSDRLEVSLRSDLTFEQILRSVIKYEYKEGKFHIPEGQFGLGYSNLMMIIGELIDYIDKYPKQECHSKINLICIEEPEAFMHSQMQELFIKHINDAIDYLLKDKQKQINSQIIITTHSSHILNSKIHSGNSFDNISYITIVDNLSNVINLNDRNVMTDKPVPDSSAGIESADNEEAGKKRLADDLKFLKKHIKYKVSELFFSDAVIFVEGITEETLLSYYIDQDDNLNQYYISVFNINGAHGLVYHPLLKLLKVPNLIITDLDIKRTEDEKISFSQISDLTGRLTTNKTIAKYNPAKYKIDNLKGYFEDENIYVVFQREAVEGYYATSFEEAFILTNYQNSILNTVLSKVRHQIYSGIVGPEKNKNKLKEKSYKLQSNISISKSDFSNELLYEIVVSNDEGALPKLPKYITDALSWLACSVKKQVKGGSN